MTNLDSILKSGDITFLTKAHQVKAMVSTVVMDRESWCASVHGTLKSQFYPAPDFERIISLTLSLLYGPILTSMHDYWKSHSFDYTNLCQQGNVSAF